MAARKARLEDLKNGSKSMAKKTPAQNGAKDKNDLGF
jgi:hypothetical protein